MFTQRNNPYCDLLKTLRKYKISFPNPQASDEKFPLQRIVLGLINRLAFFQEHSFGEKPFFTEHQHDFDIRFHSHHPLSPLPAETWGTLLKIQTAWKYKWLKKTQQYFDHDRSTTEIEKQQYCDGQCSTTAFLAHILERNKGTYSLPSTPKVQAYHSSIPQGRSRLPNIKGANFSTLEESGIKTIS